MSNGEERRHDQVQSLPGQDSPQNYVVKIQHRKCPVVQLVRQQITKVDGTFSSKYEELKRENTLYGRLWRRRVRILSLLVLLFLLWLVLMYGVFLGTSLCGDVNKRRFSRSCSSAGLGLSGIISTDNRPIVY